MARRNKAAVGGDETQMFSTYVQQVRERHQLKRDDPAFLTSPVILHFYTFSSNGMIPQMPPNPLPPPPGGSHLRHIFHP